VAAWIRRAGAPVVFPGAGLVDIICHAVSA